MDSYISLNLKIHSRLGVFVGSISVQLWCNTGGNHLKVAGNRHNGQLDVLTLIQQVFQAFPYDLGVLKHRIVES